MSQAVATEQRHFVKNAAMFFLGTVLSRMSGLCRELAMAFFFGAGKEISAFLVAYRLANLGRRLLGEGALNPGVIPHFEKLRAKDPKQACQYIADLMSSLALMLTVVLAVVEVGLVLWRKETGDDSIRLIISLTMIMLPALVFLTVQGISTSVMQCYNRFFIPSVSPVLFNGVWIAALFYVSRFSREKGIYILAFSISIALFVQMMMVFLPVKRLLRSHGVKFHFFSHSVMQIFKPLGFGLVGIGAMQINSALDAISARYASVEGPAYLWYAFRLQQLPLALFGLALSSAILPPMSRAARNKDMVELKKTLHFALRVALVLLIPCVVGLLGFSAPVINLVYRRGAFDFVALHETMRCLIGYTTGLLPSVLVIIFAQIFYAQKDYKMPMQAAVLSVVFNIFLNALFIMELKMDAYGVALSTSLSSVLNCGLLMFMLHKKMRIAIASKLVFDGFRLTFLAGVAVVVVRHIFPSSMDLPAGLKAQFDALFYPGLAFLGLYFVPILFYRKGLFSALKSRLRA